MMAIAIDKPAPAWRNFVAWAAASAIPYTVAMLAGISLMHKGSMGTLLRPEIVLVLGLTLLLAMTLVGFTRRKRPINFRNFRNFLVSDSVAVSLLLLAAWAFRAFGAARAMRASEAVAAFIGLILIVCAIAGTLVTASARSGADIVEDEVAADEMRERSALYFYSFIWIGVFGLLMIGLSLAGPGGVLPPTVALAGALVAIAVLAMLWIAAWRLSDELGRTLSYETGNMAFCLILTIGGGWAILAHLGFVTTPAPLDWLTLFTVLMLAGSVIAAGRRKLLTL